MLKLKNKRFTMLVKKTGKGKGILDVTEADYKAQLARVKDKDAVLKPGRYRYERGGFKRRHPDFAPPNEQGQNLDFARRRRVGIFPRGR